MTRYAFISRLGSVAYVAVTYDENGGNLPSEIDGNKIEWNRIEASHGEVFSLVSTADMERDLHEAGIHITETRTKSPPSSVLLLVRRATGSRPRGMVVTRRRGDRIDRPQVTR